MKIKILKQKMNHPEDKNCKTFPRGGVHPDDSKLCADQPIILFGPPKKVAIPVSQHLGKPANILVKPFEEVKTGQLIAQSDGYVSANVHSSVTGKVKKIDSVMDSSGYKRTAVLIDVAEEESWMDGIDLFNNIIKDINLDPKEIIKKIIEAGIVGLGGATFPSHVKLSIPEGKTCEYLLINGVECEPYLTADHRLMLEKGEEILVGTQILMKTLGVSEAFIGIESNKPDAIQHLSKLAENYPGINVQTLKVQYPQGAEKQLIEAMVNRQVPSGGLPIDVGCVVHNVATVFAVYEAVQKNKPLIERVVTVTGKDIQKPSNFLVRIGTNVAELVAAVGGMPENTGKILSGGPMMGRSLQTIEVPVAKGTSGIVLIPESEAKRKEMNSCIRCAKCVMMCPLGLEPYLLMALTQRDMLDQVEHELAMNCCECGSCQYVCPSNRPLLDYIRLGKSKVSQIMRSRANS